MDVRYAFGAVLAFVGVLVIAFSRALGALQARSQPLALRPWKRAAAGSRAIFIAIGIGLVLAGMLEIAGATW